MGQDAALEDSVGALHHAREGKLPPTMLSISSIALSGMSAAQHNAQAAAHNIANLATPNFRRQQVEQASAAAGGVSTSISRAAQPGSSLETDLVGVLQAKNAFLANLAVFRASVRTTGSLLDAVS